MKKENWIWMPHAGHFCCADRCEFKLNTYVGKYIVSTVGEYRPDSDVIKICYPELSHLKGEVLKYKYINEYSCEDIGANRKFETMVFKAIKSGYKCCPYKIVGIELDFKGYDLAKEACQGHLKLCKKWSAKS